MSELWLDPASSSPRRPCPRPRCRPSPPCSAPAGLPPRGGACRGHRSAAPRGGRGGGHRGQGEGGEELEAVRRAVAAEANKAGETPLLAAAERGHLEARKHADYRRRGSDAKPDIDEWDRKSNGSMTSTSSTASSWDFTLMEVFKGQRNVICTFLGIILPQMIVTMTWVYRCDDTRRRDSDYDGSSPSRH